MIILNKKKIIQGSVVLLILLFSFYYTDKSIDLIRQSDPIMKQIKSTNESYEVEAENAKIIGNKIIPGLNGQIVDSEESYNKMKKYGTYNESLTTFQEVKPTVSVDDYYDKFIVQGNPKHKSVALVFKVPVDADITEISNILLSKNVSATLFLDGLYIENHLDQVSNFSNFELELLSYDGKYEEAYFRSALNYLMSITKKEPKYCYADYDQKEVLTLCSKLELHTILPTIKVGNYPYREIKQKLDNSAIISLPVNSSTAIELPSVIDYIAQRGYSFLTLEALLSESISK